MQENTRKVFMTRKRLLPTPERAMLRTKSVRYKGRNDCKQRHVDFSIKHMYTSTLKSYNVDANLDGSDNVFSGNEPSSEMLTSQRQKLE